MKTKLIVYAAFLLLMPSVIYAQTTEQVYIQGTVGDFSTSSRTYEINGTIYDFPNAIVLVDASGNDLTFDQIKAGSLIKVIGDKALDGAGRGTIEWKKIILLN